MAKQYTWTNADGLTLGGGRNSPDTSTPEYTAELSQADITAVQALVSGGGNRPLWSIDRKRAKRVMSGPPTPTFTTALTIASPLHWPAITNSGSGAVGGGCFSYFGCGKPTRTSASFPDDRLVGFPYVSYGSTNYNTRAGASFLHDGRYLEIQIKGNGGVAMVKIDDEYLSLTPQTLTNDGSIYYWYFDFGSRAIRRIDLIAYSLRFGGVYTQQTDSIIPAPRRGPKTIIMGDSFTEGTGATQPMTWVWEFAEQLGWDDVWSSSIGGSGYLSGPATNPTFRQRFAADVAAYSPELVIFAGGINDTGIATQAEILAECRVTFALARSSLPNARLMAMAPFWKGGAASMSATLIAARLAVKQAAAEYGMLHLDAWEMPLKTNATSITTTLAASATATATSISTNDPLAIRGTYAFADGTRFQAKAISGSGPYTITIDAPGLQVGQSAGAAVTQIGDPVFTGNGKVGSTIGYGNSDLNVSSDGTHPSPEGHAALGQCNAGLMIDAITTLPL